jgi:hypothetical protein
VNALALVFSSGWASGVNCYLVVLVLAVADRVNDTEQVPNVLQRWDVLLAGQADSLNGAVAAVVGGGTALLSHSVKAGARLAINSSPEPVTNIAASLTEDAAVLGVVWFAIQHPVAAASVAAALLAGGLVLPFLLARLVRRGWRRWKGKGPARAVA